MFSPIDLNVYLFANSKFLTIITVRFLFFPDHYAVFFFFFSHYTGWVEPLPLYWLEMVKEGILPLILFLMEKYSVLHY